MEQITGYLEIQGETGNDARRCFDLVCMRSLRARVKGLIGQKSINPAKAYLFKHCKSVHTWFMSVPIDVIICDKYLCVLHVETMQPWRTSSPKIKGAHTIIEVAAGRAKTLGITVGESLCEIRNLLD